MNKYDFSVAWNSKTHGRVDFVVYPGGNALPGLSVVLMSEQEAIEAGEDERDVKEFSDSMLFDMEEGVLTAEEVMKLIGVRGVKNESYTVSLWA